MSGFEEKQFHFDVNVFTETWYVRAKKCYAFDGSQMLYNEGHFNQNYGVLIYVSNK